MTLDHEVTGNCKITGKPYTVKVNIHDYAKWERGVIAQVAFPYLSPDDREFLISKISPEGWAQIFD